MPGESENSQEFLYKIFERLAVARRSALHFEKLSAAFYNQVPHFRGIFAGGGGRKERGNGRINNFCERYARSSFPREIGREVICEIHIFIRVAFWNFSTFVPVPVPDIGHGKIHFGHPAPPISRTSRADVN